MIRSVDGFTALDIGEKLRRRSRAYRDGFQFGYLIGRASALDDLSERRRVAHRPQPDTAGDETPR